VRSGGTTADDRRVGVELGVWGDSGVGDTRGLALRGVGGGSAAGRGVLLRRVGDFATCKAPSCRGWRVCGGADSVCGATVVAVAVAVAVAVWAEVRTANGALVAPAGSAGALDVAATNVNTGRACVCVCCRGGVEAPGLAVPRVGGVGEGGGGGVRLRCAVTVVGGWWQEGAGWAGLGVGGRSTAREEEEEEEEEDDGRSERSVWAPRAAEEVPVAPEAAFPHAPPDADADADANAVARLERPKGAPQSASVSWEEANAGFTTLPPGAGVTSVDRTRRSFAFCASAHSQPATHTRQDAEARVMTRTTNHTMPERNGTAQQPRFFVWHLPHQCCNGTKHHPTRRHTFLRWRLGACVARELMKSPRLMVLPFRPPALRDGIAGWGLVGWAPCVGGDGAAPNGSSEPLSPRNDGGWRVL